jgi:cell division protein FtsX
MKVLIGIVGAFAAAAAAALFYGKWIAAWYTSRSEFQSPDEFEETYGTVYLAVIFISLVVGYIIGRYFGAKIDRQTRGQDNFVD